MTNAKTEDLFLKAIAEKSQGTINKSRTLGRALLPIAYLQHGAWHCGTVCHRNRPGQTPACRSLGGAP